MTRAVFDLLESRVSEGEIQDVIRALPEDLRQLWKQPQIS